MTASWFSKSDGTQRFDRRLLLKAGGVSVGAIALPSILQQRAEGAIQPKAKQAIVILLQGGCSQLDSWDLKPDAPVEFRGEYKPAPTTVPGLSICEHMPLLAKQAHHYNVLRSVYHGTPSHEAAIHWVLTGYNYPGANTTTRNRNIKPSMGSIVSKRLGPSRPGLPPYVCVPDRGQLGDRVRYAAASFLGMAHDPFEAGLPPTNPKSPPRMPPNLSLASGIDLRRLDHRLNLLKELDDLPRTLDSSGTMDGLDTFNHQAISMLANDATRDAFDLSKEPLALREKYGATRVGQQAILGRRLAEAGVPMTLLNFSNNQEWDTHTNNFKTLKASRLPEMDRAVATLIDDLHQRGMLETTLVALITEFGRTPKINKTAGRDHWSNVFSIMLAGGGLKSGQVLGTSNARAEVPHDRPVHYNEVLATIYHQLGVPIDHVHYDTFGRPVPVLFSGKPIRELI